MKIRLKKLPFLLFAALLFSVLILAGCASLGSLGAAVAENAGIINRDQADAISSAAESMGRAFEQLTAEQEYYIGRSVAANLMDVYPPLDNPQANAYLNRLGQALAMSSDKPYTFNGYRFILLDSDEINAFATPGGFILITRGMLECAPDEGALAAVLSHEIGHVVLDHGIKAIKSSRWTDAITKTAVSGVTLLGSDMAEVADAFSGSIDDITQSLVVGGYSREQEKQADNYAAKLLARVGYNPADIIRMLEEMDKRWDPHGHGFAATHPAPKDRIKSVKRAVEKQAVPAVTTTPERRMRYQKALKGI